MKISYKKEIAKCKDNYDVIVIGGGSAGICAAISSARNGAKTLLIENTAFLAEPVLLAEWLNSALVKKAKSAV